MAVYDASGATLGAVYNANGNALSAAYDAAGEVIYRAGAPQPNYDSYSRTIQWPKKSISFAQGFDIYDDKIFWVKKSGNGTVNNAMYIFSLNGEYALGEETPYITAYGGHGNNVTFSTEFYDDNDNIPLVLMSTAYSDSPAYLNRITNGYTAEIIKKYKMPLIEDVINGAFDICYGETADICYTASVFGANDDPELGTHIGLAKWDMTDLTENEDGTFTPAFIASARADWHSWKQGIKYHDGLLWLASAPISGAKAYVYALDPNTGQTIHTIDTGNKSEIEGAVWYPDESAVGGYALYVGFQGMEMWKFTFNAL